MMQPLPPDHCTLWPDRLFGLDWSACCAAHDAAYGIYDPQRLNADMELWRCVAETAPVMACVMLAGGAAFGWAFWRRK